jgi:hypothetical protein
MTPRLVPLLAFMTALSACRRGPPDPAPAPEPLEIVSAPPGALGALAAGTDAAPPAAEPASPFGGEEEAEEAPPGEGFPAPPADVEPDAGPPSGNSEEVPL